MATLRSLAPVAWIALASIAGAAEIHVPADHTTIQAAIDAAQTGDVVVVADGVYTGPGNKGLHFPGPVIVLRSANGPKSCILDLQGSGVAFFLAANEDPGIVVQGFTVKNGAGQSGGAAFLHHDADLTFVDCVFTGNSAARGGAVFLENSASATFVRCTFTNNSAEEGGAVYATHISDPTFVACRFTGNVASAAGGAIHCSSFGGEPRFLDCIVTGNVSFGDGAGAYVRQGTASFHRGTFAGNAAGGRGGGLAVRGPATAVFAGGILWDDAASAGGEIALFDDAALGGAALVVDWSDVQGGAADAFVEAGSVLLFGPTNQDADPLFLDLPSGDVRVPGDSPVVDSGDPGATPAFPFDVLGFGHPRLADGDFDGVVVVDQGAVEFGGLLGPAAVSGGSPASLELWSKGGALYGVVLGSPGAPIDLGAAGTVFLAPAPTTLVAMGTLPASGTAAVFTAIAPPSAIGVTVHFQAGTIGPAPADGLQVTNLESLAIVSR